MEADHNNDPILRNSDSAQMIITLIIGALVYGLAGFVYIHSEFIPRAEADARAHARDKFEDQVIGRFDRIEEKLDRLLVEKQN